MKTAYFCIKETSYNLYSAEIPAEMENATKEEIMNYITSGNADIQYQKNIDSENAEYDFDYRFDIVNS